MDARQHYLEAERLLKKANDHLNEDTVNSGTSASAYSSAAQVHATLALAAIQAVQPSWPHGDATWESVFGRNSAD